MSEEKKKIMENIGREFPGLTEQEKNYLVGFMEGVAAIAGSRTAAEPGK